MFVLVTVFTIFGSRLYCLVMKMFCISKDYTNTEDVTEDLDEYWQNLVGKEQMEWFANELYNRSALKIKTLDNRSLEKLRTTKRTKKYFSGAVNYEILSNLKYCELF
jgi:hypothetical protein